jgi:hypothetical protein
MELGKDKRRHEFQADHGFRKWFKTRCESAGMRSINIETLMGHSLGLSDPYYRPTEGEILNDYLIAIDALTLSNVHEMKEKLEELMVKAEDSDRNTKGQLEEKDQAIVALSDRVMRLSNEIDILKNKFRI